MDTNLLFAILIALVPVLVTVIASRLYNVIHGVITFLFMGHLLMFCLTVFGGNLPAELLEATNGACALYVALDDLVVGLLNSVGLASLLEGTYGVYIVLAAYLVVFLISQIIAGALRKKRVERVKILRRQIRRY